MAFPGLARLARGGFSFAARAGLLQQRFASFQRKLGDNEVIGFTKQGGEFLSRQSVSGFQGNPLRAGQLRRRDNPGALGELRKIFR